MPRRKTKKHFLRKRRDAAERRETIETVACCVSVALMLIVFVWYQYAIYTLSH